jgi:hypothetical protein
VSYRTLHVWSGSALPARTVGHTIEMDSDAVTIRYHVGHDRSSKRRLEEGWEVGLVANIVLLDGRNCSAVLIGISSTALILDHWDKSRRGPAGNPFTLDLTSVVEVKVP